MICMCAFEDFKIPHLVLPDVLQFQALREDTTCATCCAVISVAFQALFQRPSGLAISTNLHHKTRSSMNFAFLTSSPQVLTFPRLLNDHATCTYPCPSISLYQYSCSGRLFSPTPELPRAKTPPLAYTPLAPTSN